MLLFSLACTIKAPEPGPNSDNFAPEASVILAPEALTAAVDIVAAATADDLDEDPIAWTFTWSIDGEEVQHGISNFLPAGTAARGEEVEVVAVAWDGIDESEPVTASGVLENALPEVTSLTIEPSDPEAGEPLDCAAETEDADGDPVDVEILWLVDGEEYGSEVPADTTQSGETWVCIATPDDGEPGWPAETYVVIP